MAMPDIGQVLIVSVEDGRQKGSYLTRLLEIDNRFMHMELAVDLTSDIPCHIESGTMITVHYAGIDGTPCYFQTVVRGGAAPLLPKLLTDTPKKEQVVRQQRRDFVRVPLIESVELVYLNTEKKEVMKVQGTTRDISGGGIRLSIPRSFPIRNGDVAGLSFALPLDQTRHIIVVKAWMIRSSERLDDVTRKMCSAKFIELSKDDQQKIIQYSYKKQIKMKEKGL